MGARGSIPVSGSDKSEFGQATSCYMVEAGEHVLFLDAGSGITDVPAGFAPPEGRVSVLLSHVHLDHIQGLPFFPLLGRKDFKIDLYVPLDGEDALHRVFSPPV